MQLILERADAARVTALAGLVSSDVERWLLQLFETTFERFVGD
jgi:hypothetical protein